MMMSRTVRRDLWLVTLLTLGTFLLRIINLTARSLWLDEGFTLLRVTGSWADLLRNIVPYHGVITVDTNPQVYFAALKLLAGGAGTTEFSLKWLSLVAGTLCVPLIFVLARRLTSHNAALFAATLMAISPLAQWFSHELRMYTPVLCESCLSMYLLHRAMSLSGRAQLTSLVGWVVCIGVAVLTHYSFGALLVMQIMYAVGWFASRRRTAPLRIRLGPLLAVVLIGWAAGMVVAVATGGTALFARLLSGAEYSFSFVPLHTIVPSIIGQTLFGMNTTDPTDAVFTWAIAAFCVAGVAAHIGLRSPMRANLIYLAICTAGPMLVWFAISFIKPNFHNVRHLMLLVPPLLVLLAALLDARAWKQAWVLIGKPTALPYLQPVTTVISMCLVAANVYGLSATFQSTPDWQDDWRSLTQYIRTHWQPGDGLLENAGTPYPVTRRYLGAHGSTSRPGLRNRSQPAQRLPASACPRRSARGRFAFAPRQNQSGRTRHSSFS